ncbi:DegV family protein [Corynebacterium kroppenstedtii]|uniref:DegV family protein n=1 Tax=Corynebacterium sp. PCR 32 TaxID=3351342 RepID=UPI0030948C98
MVSSDDDSISTSGLTALELAAAYGRELERSGDDGVVAIHLGQTLSSTWSSAVAASAVCGGKVRVVETDSVGMPVGEAALAAARAAREGRKLEECVRRASAITGRSSLFLYLDRVDALRRSGRMSTMSSLVSSALPVKSLFSLHDGSFGVVARTRTQAKAIDRLVGLVVDAATSHGDSSPLWTSETAASSQGPAEGDPTQVVPQNNDVSDPVRICIHHAGAHDRARMVITGIMRALAVKKSVIDLSDRWGIGEHPDAEVIMTQADLSGPLAVHTGAGAIAVSVIVPEVSAHPCCG